MTGTEVTGYTKEHMDAIANGTIASLNIVSGHLIATTVGGANIDLGQVQGPAGTNGTNGTNGATGPTGPPGTAGVWIQGSPNSDLSFPSISPVNSGYQVVGTIVVPAAAYARHVSLWGKIMFQGLTTDVATYRGSIRDTSLSTSTDQDVFIPSTAGYPGSVKMQTGPIPLGASVSKTYEMRVRRDSGSGGVTESDATFTKFYAYVTAD